MMAVQYIVGMVSSPVESLLGFMQSFQDAKISMERLNEIYETEDEEDVKRIIWTICQRKRISRSVI
ncbi:hypothetical protein KUH03_23515 [Sphingobacterium sp. E70]|uniref:hypothetical protein n=1 Tax=Sphingobacterium sp. E70 TaxID=2853439 RepID=UPI00211BE098|nr:hypothetical protein [Sphingobacterium sp. E70]ULT22391.1 hypothetical protein KUH03_23515 [Sphingobacterium sp. E70]